MFLLQYASSANSGNSPALHSNRLNSHEMIECFKNYTLPCSQLLKNQPNLEMPTFMTSPQRGRINICIYRAAMRNSPSVNVTSPKARPAHFIS